MTFYTPIIDQLTKAPVTVLRSLLERRIEEEQTTYEAVAANATWRATLLV